MANMHFKANLLPSSDLDYSLGSLEKRWKINGFTGGPVEYIVNTNTAKSSAWTGVTQDSKLTIGKVIALKINNTPSGNASLNLTFTNPADGEPSTSGAIAIYLNTTRLTTHYSNGAVILLVYDGTNWRSTDYWNTNSRDAGYGKITPVQSQAETAITTNTTQLVATTYTEAMKVAAGNKWIQLAGTNGGNGADILTIAHNTSGVTAGNYGDNSNQTPNYGDTFNVPYISVDAGGHITDISSHTVQLPSDNAYIPKSIGTTKGDIIYWTSEGTPVRLGIGTDGYFLKATSNGPAYSALTSSEILTALGYTPYNATNPEGYNNYSLPIAKNDELGGVKPWYSHTSASKGPTAGSNATSITVNTITTTAGKYYAIESDSNGRLFTNIPWENTWTALSTSSPGYVGTKLPGNTTTFLRGDGTWNIPSYPVTSVASKTGAITLGTLTIGDKTYNGSTNTTIEIADLGLASTTTFLGITTTNLSDGSTTSPINIVIGPTTGNVAPNNGSVVMEQDSGEEYIWTGNKWNIMGLASSWALANHIHGNILNNGTITNDTSTGNGQHLVITDSNDKITRSSLTFDTTKSTEYLTHAGTWATPLNDNTTYTFANGVNGFTVTPSNGTAQTITVTPSIANNITGSGTSGYLAKFNGSNTITNGPQLGNSISTFLNNKGEWAIPAGDHQVLQKAAITSAGNYPILLGYNTTTTSDVTNVVNTTSTLNYNPSTQKLHVPAIELTDVSYGSVLPLTGTEGQVFFQISDVLSSGYVEKAGDTMTGNLTIDRTNIGEADMSVNSLAGSIYLYSQNSATGQRGIKGNNNAGITQDMLTWNQDGTLIIGSILQGAAQNDYAEFRKSDVCTPGKCVTEIGNGELVLTNKRLQRGCEIISDTFGFIIGENKEKGYTTPIAICGRVLAYPYESLDEFKSHIGWPVCSGPNGTVSIMTEEEEEKYSSRIIGVISEIPDYDIWGENNIQINGRVWIRVR